METREVSVPYVIEDFSPGDRVYRVHKKDGDTLGRIKSVSGKSVLVTMDNGEDRRVPISAFDFKRNRIWGKALDLDYLSVGDRISRQGFVGFEGRRTYATVLSFTQDNPMERIIVIEMELPRKTGIERSVRQYKDKPDYSLEWHFTRWELEG